MSSHKLYLKRINGIFRLLISLILILLLLQTTPLYAAKANVKDDVAQLQMEQQQLNDRLQQFMSVGNKLIADNKKFNKHITELILISSVLAVILLGIIIFVFSSYSRQKSALKQFKKSNNKDNENQRFQNNQIANLQQAIGEHRDQIKALKQEQAEQTQIAQKKLQQLHEKLAQIQQQESIAEEQLEQLLNYPVDYILSSSETEQLQKLIRENQLSFSSSLKAKALEEEYSQAWQKAISYWQTYLIDSPNDTEALLHIGYDNYQLALEDSKDDYHLNQAMQAFEKIMLAAPDYFDDMQGYDGEESLNEANDFNENSKEYNLYRQLENYLMKLDELRNYRSIYQLACSYANDGKVKDAQNCLEHIPAVFHAPHCQQLQKDSNLSILRQFDWFNKLIEEACKCEA